MGWIHSVLQQLEILKIVEKDPKGGRRITSDGQVSLSRPAPNRIALSSSQSPRAHLAIAHVLSQVTCCCKRAAGFCD